MPSDNSLAFTLAQYRLEQSRDCLASAVREVNAEAYKSAANRSYYCIFHAMRAMLALEDFDSKKHSGVISVFRQRYVKTGIFPPEFSDIIQNAFNNRGKSDYTDFFVISKEDTYEQIEHARIFLVAVEENINAQISGLSIDEVSKL